MDRRALLLSLGFLGATPALAAPPTLTFETPKGWKKETTKDGATVLSSQENPKIEFRITILRPFERGGQDIRAMFRSLWTEILKTHPDDKYEPSIAVIDAQDDTLIAFDGTEFLRTQDTPDIFLYVVEAGEWHFPIIVLWRKEGINFDTGETRIGQPMLRFIGRLKVNGASGHRSPLVQKNQLVGTWERLLVGSLGSYYSSGGSYVGDASTGGSLALNLKPDGTYDSSFALVVNGKPSGVSTHKGKWTLEKHILALTPTSASKPLLMKRKQFYVFGTGKESNGKPRLMMAGIDEPGELARALTYLMNFGSGSSTYNYTRK